MAKGYDPEWIEFEKAAGKPNLPDDIDGRREAFNAVLVQLAKQLPPTDPGIQTRDQQISSDVKVRVYTPPGSDSKNLPLIVFAHGGGWLSGNLDTEDHLCRTVCGEVECIVVSVDYRIFPFAKFPAPIDDCYIAYQWAYEHADSLGADRSRYSIWGGSAGAAPAVAVAYKLVSSGHGDRISGLITMAGMLLDPRVVPKQYQHLHKSYVENGGAVPIVTGDDMKTAFDQIVGIPGTQDVNWFPLTGGAEALKGFPRTYIINTDKEALRDDGLVLEATLKDAGVSVKRDNLPGLPHYFWCFPVEKAGKRFRDTLVQGIKWVVHPE